MGRQNAVPDRWVDYHCIGGIIPGTRFIAFKVPLREGICSRLPAEARFTPADLLQRIHGLGLVIDLTCTDRYYDRQFILRNGVHHVKIVCAGQQIPHEGVVRQFTGAVDQFLVDPRNSGKLIGVHCTHGVNRTGYLVCKYMIQRLGIAPTVAVNEFENARGHKFDRQEYVDDLSRSLSTLSQGRPFSEVPLPYPTLRSEYYAPVAEHHPLASPYYRSAPPYHQSMPAHPGAMNWFGDR